MIKVAPSVLSGDYAKLGESVALAEKWGGDYLHFDVMDGVFVPNITVGMPSLAAVRSYCSLPFDVHLMIINPEKYVEKFAAAGADIITVHYEACKENLESVLRQIKAAGVKCGAVINPDTPVCAIEKVIPLCDMVLVMSVFPGFGGQKFIPSVLDKVREIRAIANGLGLPLDIQIDGGINEETAALAREAGANILVAGNAVFKAENRAEMIVKLKA